MIKMKTIRTILMTILLGTLVIGQAQNKLDNKVLMTIADEQVTVKEFMDVYSKNNVNNEVIDKKITRRVPRSLYQFQIESKRS